MQELRGEKIDIVPYDRRSGALRLQRDRARPRSRACIIDAGSHTMELIVPDDKLSLAIGKKGQNVRLASQLTGWRIDIHSETKVARDGGSGRAQSLAAIEGADGASWRRALFKLGWRSAADVAAPKPDELAAVPGVGGAASAQAVHRGGGARRRDRAHAATPKRRRARCASDRRSAPRRPAARPAEAYADRGATPEGP